MKTIVPSIFQSAIFNNVASGAGHVVVNAVAGSGKTTTIEAAINYVPAGLKILFVSFNKGIAKELALRVGDRAEASTLHTYGLKCVTAGLGRLTIDKRRVHSFVDDLYGETVDALERAVTASKDDVEAERLIAEIEAISDRCRILIKVVSLAKGALALTEAAIGGVMDHFDLSLAGWADAEDDEVVRADRVKFVGEVLGLLRRCYLTKDGRLDMDDMIWLPVVHNLRQRKFDRLFIDETQDLNLAQIELALRACKPEGRILAVGDPRQAIYGFRGADEHAFQNVKGRLGAAELPLSVSYRCCRAVVREAQTIVANIEAAPDADEGEVRTAVSFDAMTKGALPGDFVLSRTNAPLIGLCMAFLKEGRRANIQGRDVGTSLAAFVKKGPKGETVEALRSRVEDWAKKEIARLAAKKADTQAAEDRAECLLALSDGASSVESVVARIEEMFSDKDSAGYITLSTTHKAKGLERDRVWLLKSTYRRRPGIEEDNLYYVAVTRAKTSLFLVDGRTAGKSAQEAA